MTASVTFQEPRAAEAATDEGTSAAAPPPPPIVLVPKRTVAEQGGQSIVWVVAGGAAKRRVVTLGSERLDQVEVKSGVAPGETLILNPPPGLTDRAVVRVKGT
jgi:hypothetical protein